MLVEDLPTEVYNFEIDLKSCPGVKEGRYRVSLAVVTSEVEFNERIDRESLNSFDGIVMDIMLRRTSNRAGGTRELETTKTRFDAGIRCCHELRSKGWSTPVLLCSHYGRQDLDLSGLPRQVSFAEKARLKRLLPGFLDKLSPPFPV
jgi:CheY-like chemotaxis protein